MKRNFSFLFVFLFLLGACTKREKVIELPLTYYNEARPFSGGLYGMGFSEPSEDSQWDRLRVEYTGAPADWTEVLATDVILDHNQFVYQMYAGGKIPEDFYRYLVNAWGLDTAGVELSDKPLRASLGMMRGRDQSGQLRYILDSNNNLDFSDDELLEVPVAGWGEMAEEGFKEKYTRSFVYERVLNGRVVEEKGAVLIVELPYNNDMLFYSFQQHAETVLKGQKIGIAPNFSALDYQHPTLALVSDTLKTGDVIQYAEYVGLNEYVVIDDVVYQFLGVDRQRDVLKLKRINQKKDEIESSQIGYKAIPFAGINLLTGDSIALSDYRGKYVYVDFWSLWCGPCIQELPLLKDIYERIDHSRVEFIGILEGRNPENQILERIEKSAISWAQIRSDEVDGVNDRYGITGFPTTFLIGPDGVILDKNIRAHELQRRLNEVLVNE